MNVALKQRLMAEAGAGRAGPALADVPPPLMRGIALSPEQQAVLRPGWQREQPRIRTLAARRRGGLGLARADAEEMRAISARSMAAVERVLTPSQREQYDRNVAARRAWVAARGMTPAAPAAAAAEGRP